MSVKLVTGVMHKYRVNTCLQNENDSVFCDLLPEIEQRSLFATLHFALKIDHCLLESSKEDTALLDRHMYNFFFILRWSPCLFQVANAEWKARNSNLSPLYM